MASGSSVLAPSSNAVHGLVGVTTKSKRSNTRAEVLGDLRPHLLRGPVVGVVVAAGQRVGAEHDPALDLGAEAGRAGAAVHRLEVCVAGDPQPVADAVEASQVGRRLGRRDQVVGRQRVRRVRQPAGLDRRPEPLGQPQRGLEALAARRARSPPRLLAGRAAPPARRAGSRAGPRRVGGSIGAGNAQRGRVAAVVADHVREQQRGVGDVAGQRPGLIQRGGEGDHPVARARAVGRLQPDDPAQRRRLADRAAGVGADRPRRQTRRPPRRRSRPRSRRARGRDPTG